MDRRTLREKVIQGLFQMDMTNIPPSKALENMIVSVEDMEQISKKEKLFLTEILEGVHQYKETMDKHIERYLKGWVLSRLSYIDRAILRMATFEILYQENIPGKVSINEAVELTKTFSTEESKQYINGVLSNIFHEQDPEHKEEETVEKNHSWD